ncbi:3-dehydroquinate synthase family protein [Gryllotalpicola sp.]|uniref:3-dehydroquinate synthase n=1 Tax=Gryllotalpicola sp. TaxID=1932787 RepID=UPI002623F57C|nr:3-dehydroquinate synthase family protein [Gryllotalpicola sp.]
MSEIAIHSSFGDYTVVVAQGSADAAADAAVTLADPVVADRLPPVRAVVTIAGAESSKTLAGCEQTLVAMNRAGLRRGDVVAAVGGGVVQDVATLACSLYMRGVDWVYVPTTLMAMMDSCIGGKSSINVGGVKNLVGNFYPPRRILVDPVFIESLPQRARVSGLAEAVKICFARGPEAFERFLASPAALAPADDGATAELIAHVLESKKWFVEIDEFDKAERQLLNFGHSFGHAFEAACGFRVQHGIGVAIGMLAALRHPASRADELTERLSEYARVILATVAEDVATSAAATDWAVFRRALAADKKNAADRLRLVLPTSELSLTVVSLPLDDDQLSIAELSLRSALEDLAA